MQVYAEVGKLKFCSVRIRVGESTENYCTKFRRGLHLHQSIQEDSPRPQKWHKISTTSPPFSPSTLSFPAPKAASPIAPEWPYLRNMLGSSVSSVRVLDLGCGFGWFCRWARDEGDAVSVHGIDVSENMLKRARAWPSSDSDGKAVITYEIGDLETIQLPKQGYDVVYSSLALHYIPDLARLIAEIRKTLVPGGRFCLLGRTPHLHSPDPVAGTSSVACRSGKCREVFMVAEFVRG